MYYVWNESARPRRASKITKVLYCSANYLKLNAEWTSSRFGISTKSINSFFQRSFCGWWLQEIFSAVKYRITVLKMAIYPLHATRFYHLQRLLHFIIQLIILLCYKRRIFGVFCLCGKWLRMGKSDSPASSVNHEMYFIGLLKRIREFGLNLFTFFSFEWVKYHYFSSFWFNWIIHSFQWRIRKWGRCIHKLPFCVS